MRWFRITRFIRSTRLTAGLQYTDSTRCVRRFIPYFFTARLALGATPAACRARHRTQHTQYDSTAPPRLPRVHSCRSRETG